MEITHEIMAAYADGTLPQNLLPEVRRYLATHPNELEQVIRLMDATHPEQAEDYPIITGLSTLGCASIASSGAAFALPLFCKTSRPKVRQTDIQSNLTNLLNDIL